MLLSTSNRYVSEIIETYELNDIYHQQQNFYECVDCEIQNAIDHLDDSQEELMDRLTALRFIVKQKQEEY